MRETTATTQGWGVRLAGSILALLLVRLGGGVVLKTKLDISLGKA